MSEWATCPVCGSEVHNSGTGWARHTDGPRHALVLIGLSPDEAERIILACYDAGIAYEAAIAAIRDALSQPPGELARMAAELRAFAAAADAAQEAIG